ncbi:MAG: Asp-tRNA(Asn)/Glu-tRNA(Gln) amidotransferase subunit GatA [Candidatus Sungbacteria bacterium]|nr:Asp-tRNA(Asn)/Glu-tRNA(Gln) amidotransferase subunit GatA [Candidatus Sungbacteria bacterium]
MKLNELTIKDASGGLRQKKFSVSELVSNFLQAIKEKNSELHAYLEVFDDALDEAKKADEMLGVVNHEERMKLPPLFGIPLAIKDNILIEGKKCTAGSKILENYIASYDATVIRKLKKQGAIFLGKTNLDEFAMGSSTENSAYVSTKNPYDLSRVPGGSSGGSASAVAGNLCIAALGSDTGGSIRQPASFCGIVGLKPTYGIVSRHGLIAMASSLDQIGPMAKSVEDAAILFDAIKGGDEFDSTAVKKESLEIGNWKLEIPERLKGVRIGIPKEYFGAGLDADVKKVIEAVIGKMESSGAIIKEISLPHSEYALPTYYIVVPSEISANLARFDGIRYGLSAATSYQLSATSLYEVYAKSRAYGFGAEVKRRIMLGTYTLSAGYYDAYYVKAQKVRRLIRQDFEHALNATDVILGPTAPTPAFCFGEKADNPLQMYLADIYTVAANLAGVPAISIPAGFVEREGKKLPVGLQLAGKWFEEGKLLGIAKAAEII